jgi:hypothetical protein
MAWSVFLIPFVVPGSGEGLVSLSSFINFLDLGTGIFLQIGQ